MTAYYNEIDPYAAQWLRNLIDKGYIAPGYVDERSIEDVLPDDLDGFTQCHFFAGIGIWSLALRQAGWPDDKQVWTGSCPCQPFSTAGQGKGVDDERHLWPSWFHLITQQQPSRIFGEQVASKDGLGWLDIVQTDLEAANYANAAVDLCAAGVGAPHIRQRLWFCAERLDNSNNAGSQRHPRNDGAAQRKGQSGSVTEAGVLSSMADPNIKQCKGALSGPRKSTSTESQGATIQSTGLGGDDCNGVADTNGAGPQQGDEASKTSRQGDPIISNGGRNAAGPTNGFWADADWLLCRDEKFRPVEPGTFPLADGITQRVGRLRAYGNAINAEVAKTFIESAM